MKNGVGLEGTFDRAGYIKLGVFLKSEQKLAGAGVVLYGEFKQIRAILEKVPKKVIFKNVDFSMFSKFSCKKMQNF